MTFILDQNHTIPPQEAQQFFEESFSGFLIANEKNRIVRSNNRVLNWLGISLEELIGKKFSDLLSIGSKIYFETHLSPLLKMQGFFDEILIELGTTSEKNVKIFINAKESVVKEDGSKLIYYTLVQA